MTSFWCHHYQLWTHTTCESSIFILTFKLVTTCWLCSYFENIFTLIEKLVLTNTILKRSMYWSASLMELYWCRSKNERETFQQKQFSNFCGQYFWQGFLWSFIASTSVVFKDFSRKLEFTKTFQILCLSINYTIYGKFFRCYQKYRNFQNYKFIYRK